MEIKEAIMPKKVLTKQDFRYELRNKKLILPAEYSEKVQKKLLGVGCVWNSGTEDVQFTDEPMCLYITNYAGELVLTRSSLSEISTYYYTHMNHAEITYLDILDTEITDDSVDTGTQKHCLIPFERVLVRNSLGDRWIPALFGYFMEYDELPYKTTNEGAYRYCIPYKGNETLIGSYK